MRLRCLLTAVNVYNHAHRTYTGYGCNLPSYLSFSFQTLSKTSFLLFHLTDFYDECAKQLWKNEDVSLNMSWLLALLRCWSADDDAGKINGIQVFFSLPSQCLRVPRFRFRSSRARFTSCKFIGCAFMVMSSGSVIFGDVKTRLDDFIASMLHLILVNEQAFLVIVESWMANEP